MRWRPPSERVQLILVAPIALPAAAVLAIMLVPAIPLLIWNDWRRQRLAQRGWHRWFAWHPVKFDGFFYDKPDQWLWLESVDRQLACARWEYRPIGVRKRWERPA